MTPAPARAAAGALAKAPCFGDALRAAYLQDPCAVLPNPLWKTLAQVQQAGAACRCAGGCGRHLEIWGEARPTLYWDEVPALAPPPAERVQGVTLAVLHQSRVTDELLARFVRREPYFRLVHRPDQPLPAAALPRGYRFADVTPTLEAERVARLIAASYETMRPTPETVRSWTEHPTYSPDLWLWVLDAARRPVALGIAELDPTVPEAALEYIQVVPEHRRQGIGAALTVELLRRIGARVRFTTVSGDARSRWRPEALYRRCGFAGQDVWWVLRKGQEVVSAPYRDRPAR